MKTMVYQTCDSKECYNIEKEQVGIKNIYVISRRHTYDPDKNELICETCGKITKLEKNK